MMHRAERSPRRRPPLAALRALASGALLGCALLALPAAAQSIATTKHNLSASGPGSIKAVSEGEICKFCHAPHAKSAQAPLWNRNLSGQTYVMYNSTTMDAYQGGTPPQPTGSSKLCLSCHDGTIALGSVLSQATPIAMSGGIITMPSSSGAYFGQDLSGHHPFSFQVTDAIVAANNRKDSPLKSVAQMQVSSNPARLDAQGFVQCSSCHDPHKDPFGNLFLRSASQDAVCLSCHAISGP